MTKRIYLLVCFLKFAAVVCTGQINNHEVFAFMNVSVLPMTDSSVLNNQVVLISGGKIKFVGHINNTQIPDNAKKIDASGKYLLPGFIDCYAHIHEKNPVLFAAMGITTVRNAPGAPFQHGVKKAIENKSIFGPGIYSSGPAITGTIAAYHTQGIIKSKEEARFAVRETKRMGYDAVFVYVTISPEAYTAVLDEAKKQNLKVEGHLPYMVKFKEYVTGSQVSFDNLVGFINLQTGETYPKERIVEMSRDIKAGSKYIIPTLTIHKARAMAGKDDSLRQTEIMKYVPPRQRAYWHLSSKGYKYSGASLLVKTFYEQGLKLLLGSDAGFHFVVPGFSYHDEMLNFSELGISNYDILKAGTKDAAEFLGWHEKIGIVTVGKEADLVLLDANPLEDIANAKKITGVMLKGRWYPKSELNKKLSTLENEFAQMPVPANRFASFEKPGPEYKLLGQYEIFYKNILCGEEKIFSSARGDEQRVLSQNSIDPLCQRNTTTEWAFKKGIHQAIKVKRQSIDGTTFVNLKKSGSYYRVSGELPFYGKLSFTDSLTQHAFLAGPNTSVNLDMDIIANFHVLFSNIKLSYTGQRDSVFVKKIELNPEEWGKDAVIGNVKYKIIRLPDENGMKKYEVVQPGFNGSEDFSFKAIVNINNEGMIEKIIFNDSIKAVRK